jgi:signal transduction histidine kinase
MSALHELATTVQEMFQVHCAFRCDRPVLIRENAIATNLFRIAQEGVSNAIKHGRATKVEISLEASPERVLLSVKDNGVGMSSDRPNGNGMGLRIMNRRAAVSGGKLSVQRNDAGGTTAVCTIENPKEVLLPNAP